MKATLRCGLTGMAACASFFWAGETTAETAFAFVSSPMSWVGQGESVLITPTTGSGFSFTATRSYDQGVQFAINDLAMNPDFWSTRWWWLDFAAPYRAPLTPGSYPSAERWPFQAVSSPGLSFSGNGRGNNTLSGRFTVLEAQYSGTGEVMAFAADFVQFDENIRNRWNFGSLRYQSSFALQTFPRIDSTQATHLASALGDTLLPAFDGGVLRIDSPVPTIDLGFSLSNRGGTIDANGNRVLFTGTIADQRNESGPLTLSGAGVSTFGGRNTYTGRTTISRGATLALATGASIEDSAEVRNDGSFDLAQKADGTAIRALSGDGRVLLGVGELVLTAAGGTFAGVIAGPGAVRVQAGNQVFSGANTYAGGTTINDGATLSVGSDANLGDPGGALRLYGGTLRATSNFSMQRAIHLLFRDGAFNIDAGSTLTNAGSVDGPGSVVKDGAGTLRLCGSVAHDGGFRVRSGRVDLCGAYAAPGQVTIEAGATLAVQGGSDLASAARILNGGTLDISGSSAGVTLQALDGSGSVVLGDRRLTLAGPDRYPNPVFSGDFQGSGEISILRGLHVFSGVSSGFTGTTTIVPGAVLALSGLAFPGQSTFVNHGVLDLSPHSGAAWLASLNGNGLVLLGANDLVLWRAGGSFDGEISGSGLLAVIGGAVTLGGTNRYAGGTLIGSGAFVRIAADSSLGNAAGPLGLDDGTLRTSANVSTARTIYVGARGTLITDAGTTLTSTGSVSGSGRLIKQGAGALVLAGDNAGDHTPGSGWTGGLTIDEGLVEVNNAWGLGWGDVALNGGRLKFGLDLATPQTMALAGGALLDVAPGTTTTLTGTIAGTTGGCVVKTGGGTLNLRGAATLTRGICVEQGELKVNGELAGSVGIEPAALLRGDGVLRGPVSVRGTLAPGNSPATLTVAGTVEMLPGSTFQAEINGRGTASGPGNYSRLLVTGAGNQFIAGGARLQPRLRALSGSEVYVPYVPQLGDSFRIVSAEGGIVGRFASVAEAEGLAAGTRLLAFYDVRGNRSIDLRVAPAAYGGVLSSANDNRRAAADAVDRLSVADQQGNTNSTQSEFLYALTGLPGEQIPGALNTLPGEVHAALAAVAPRTGPRVQAALRRQLGATRARSADAPAPASDDTTPRRALWIEVGGDRGHWSGDHSASGLRATRTEFAVGGDLFEADGVRAGIGLAHADTNVAQTHGAGSVEENVLFAYGQYRADAYLLDGLVGYGRSRWTSRRADPLGGGERLKTDQGGATWLAGSTLRKPFEVAATVVEPFASVLAQHVTRQATDEAGDSPAALHLRRYSATNVRAMLGLAAASLDKDPLNAALTYEVQLGLGQDWGSALRANVHASLAGSEFALCAPQVGRSFAQLRLAGTWRLSRAAYAYAGLAGEVRQGQSEVGGTVGLRVAF